MTASSVSDDRVLFEVDPDGRIATITLNNPKQRNSYDAAMREAVARCLDRVAEDDDLTVVLLRGAERIFTTGADMNNAYAWYGLPGGAKAQRRDDGGEAPPQSASTTHRGPQVIWLLPQLHGLSEGDGGRDRRLRARRRLRDGLDDRHLRHRARHEIGMPATRFLGPALGSLHMFFHRLGPVLARRLLLTGDIIEAGEIEHLGIFTDTCDPGSVTARARYWAEKAAKMPADGVVMAKEAFRLVEQTQAYHGEEVASYLFHAFGTNLQFGPGEFNFVKTRAQHGTKEAFRLRDEHFHVPEPEA